MAKIYVISGGPGTGKTSTINELEKRGYKILKEAAREVSQKDKKFKGKSILEINKKDFQDAIFEFQVKQIGQLKKLNKKEIIFSDRGFGDTLTYYKLDGLQTPKEKFDYAKKFRYEKIFILDFLNFYEQDNLRKESRKGAEKIHAGIIKTYKELEYKIINVPFISVEKRVEFILNKIS